MNPRTDRKVTLVASVILMSAFWLVAVALLIFLIRKPLPAQGVESILIYGFLLLNVLLIPVQLRRYFKPAPRPEIAK